MAKARQLTAQTTALALLKVFSRARSMPLLAGD